MKRVLAVAGVALLAGGCATPPFAPDVTVMPAYGKPFEVFAQDDAICRQFAADRIGAASSQKQATANVAEGAVAGAAIGAASGALLGHGYGGATATGAGAGLLVGSAIGTGVAGVSRDTLQRRYDIAYMQCMYAKGNVVPGVAAPNSYVSPPPPPTGYAPPPPR
jgi:uncharacterized protein YcfJ